MKRSSLVTIVLMLSAVGMFTLEACTTAQIEYAEKVAAKSLAANTKKKKKKKPSKEQLCKKACAKASKYRVQVPGVRNMRQCNPICNKQVSKKVAACAAKASSKVGVMRCGGSKKAQPRATKKITGSPTQASQTVKIRVPQVMIYPAKSNGKCWDSLCGSDAKAVAQVSASLAKFALEYNGGTTAALSTLGGKFTEVVVEAGLNAVAPPDPSLELHVNNSILQCEKIQDTVKPQWSKSVTTKVAPGDLIHIFVTDEDWKYDDPIGEVTFEVTSKMLEDGYTVLWPSSSGGIDGSTDIFLVKVTFK